MGRKKEETPEGIKRYTVQMDETLYTSIRMSALGIKVKTYELMNRIVLLGAEAWSKHAQNKDAKININRREFGTARKLNDKVLENEKVK